MRKILWKKKWQPTLIFLPGKSHGQRSLVGYHPRGCKELNTTEHAHTHTHNLRFPPVHSNPGTLTCGLAASCLLHNGMAQDITGKSFKWLVRAVSLHISQPPWRMAIVCCFRCNFNHAAFCHFMRHVSHTACG